MPPVVALFEVFAPVGEWAGSGAQLPEESRVLGPVPARRGSDPAGQSERVLITCPRRQGVETARELRAWLARRSAAKAAGSASVYADPVHLA